MKHESKEEHIMSDEAGSDQRPVSRRDALKAAGLAGAAALSTGAVASAQTADKTPIEVQAKNPYGGVPSGGITFPQYYRPTPYLASNNIYYPGQEAIGSDEMRISFIGSTPIPVSMWITTRTFPTSTPSRRGWGAGSRCACMDHPAARQETASNT